MQLEFESPTSEEVGHPARCRKGQKTSLVLLRYFLGQ
jgi:hypothetical protein